MFQFLSLYLLGFVFHLLFTCRGLYLNSSHSMFFSVDVISCPRGVAAFISPELVAVCWLQLVVPVVALVLFWRSD